MRPDCVPAERGYPEYWHSDALAYDRAEDAPKRAAKKCPEWLLLMAGVAIVVGLFAAVRWGFSQ